MRIYEELNGGRVLLIFDEIELISVETSSSDHWKHGNDFISFWQTIRAFCQEHQQQLSFLVAGVNPHCIEKVSINGVDNPIFSMLNPMYLNLFDIEDVRNMVENIGKYMGLVFDEEIFTKLVEDYGGHPFLVRHICSLINESIPLERPQRISKYDYEKEKSNYDIKISKYIEQIIHVLKRWYPAEYELLEILAVRGNDSFISNLGRNDYNTVDHLMGYGILKKHKDTYFITIKALELFLKDNSEQYLTDTIEQKRSAVSFRRNRLEETLRDLIKTILYANFGKSDARSKLLEVKKTTDRPKYDGIDIGDFMENSLYFSELKILVDKNWRLFEKIFQDKRKFNTYMEIVNDYRIDAHAKGISEDEYTMFHVAIKWIEEKL
ncbi:hypothetical protein [Sediminibacillus dalangtanensis]|uniref:hypothetical protein n=1 Tax=Sediminibacillus dalangtanensis TaxID=2729421 RepID=UPI001ADFAEED|nr:hypothetical protein [Sediminibacillus dalangtanensis]